MKSRCSDFVRTSAVVSVAAGALLLSACAGAGSGDGPADPPATQTPGANGQDDSPAGGSLGTITIDGQSIALTVSEDDPDTDTDELGYCTVGQDVMTGQNAKAVTPDGRVVTLQYHDEENWVARLIADHTSNRDVWRLDTEMMKDNPLASGTVEISGQRAVVEGVWLASMESTETANMRLEIDCGAAN